jgi:tRNA(Ile)-lysidine synthase TilS/MesJ
MGAVPAPLERPRPADGNTPPEPDLPSYDNIIVAFSGGKDSIACLISLIEAGVSRDRIELYHHDVDGGGPSFMDWPSTTAYCRAVAREFGIPLYLSWKEGGFLREMLLDNQPTAPHPLRDARRDDRHCRRVRTGRETPALPASDGEFEPKMV